MIDTQAIKSKILDLAVRGKLTEPLPEDGTAEELYHQILKEKHALLKAGKIKKRKDLPAITEEEVPFELPSNWKWVRFADICSIINGDRGKNYPAKSTLKHEGIPFISALNLNGTSVTQDENLLCLDDHQYDLLGSGKLQKDDIVICIRGSLGKHGRYPFEKGAIASSLVISRLFYQSEVLGDYEMAWLDSSMFPAEIEKYNNGTAQPNLAANNLERFLFPLPPLAEQERIVNRIKQSFSALETIDALQAEYADNLLAMKRKLIDAAIQGRLSEQLPEDGMAEELYQQIQSERKRQEAAGMIKAVELAPAIPSEQMPFSIPESWKWTTLGNVSYIVRGGSPRPIKEYITTREDGINWIKIGDVEKGGKYIYSTHEKIIPEGEAKSRRVYPGDFLLTNSMSFGRPYISKIEGCIHDGWLLIHDLSGFDPDYLYYLLSSSYLYGQFMVKASGSTVENLNIDKVKAAIIPLPPLAEQKRIVARLEELLPMCEKD